MKLLFLCLLLATAAAGLAAQIPAGRRPDLAITLGPTNLATGLVVPSGGDGSNKPETIQGSPVRRIAGERSHYLYVAIDHPAYHQGPADLYVVAEVFDDMVGRLTLQYDKAALEPNIGTKYSAASDTLLLTGSGTWRRGVFHLPDLRLGHGQNGGADFRFAGSGVAFRRITVTQSRPAGYDPDQPNDPQALRHIAVSRPPGMELTYGNDANAADAALFKALSVTSVESYVDWAGVEPKRDQWDWSQWDKQVATLKHAGLKWVPFLMAGPAYATPLWFQNGPDSRVFRCLEHGRDSKVQSLFNPHLRPQIERFLHAFATRYRDTGVIESVLLGITGIYGESIYPAGPEGGWTARLTGDYHNHHGWWAGDPLAAAAFRDAMQRQYGSIAALNKAWGTAHRTFDDVAPFLPDKAPGDRARADFVEWYQQAMTDWAVFWVKTTRKAFPKTAIYLCTGGDGNPFLGADFTAQTAAIADEGAGVRITNEGSDYAKNFGVTREVATATRHYGTFCGFEPASSVDSNGVIARIYNATASGARQLHDYTPNTLGQGADALRNFRAYAPFLVPRRPQIDAALYLSRETWALAPESISRFYALAHVLRDVADIDFVTRRSAMDGHLRQYRVLVLAESPVLEPGAASALEKWVQDGGTLIVATRAGETAGGRLHDNSAWRERMLAKSAPSLRLLKSTFDGEAPARWVLKVGTKDDEGWLSGDWHGRERAQEWRELTNAAMRWSGAHCGVLLPVKPGVDHTLRLSLSAPGFALGDGGIQVALGGRPLGVIKKPGRQTWEVALPAGLLGSEPMARLEFAATAWKPSERSPGSTDTRSLGFSLHQVEVFRHGAGKAAPSQVVVRSVLDAQALSSCSRIVGQGRTIHLSGLAGNIDLMAAVFSSVMPSAPDGKVDGRFATITEDGVLWFDKSAPRIWRTDRARR